MYKHSTQQQRRNQIETLYNAGITKGVDIWQRTSIPKQTVYCVLNQIKDKKSLQHKRGAGRPSKIKANDKRRIAALYQSNPRTSLRSILPRLSSPVSISTLYAQVKRQNFVSKRAVRVPALTDLHISKRIAWCKEMKCFDWSKTFFTDECSVWLDSGRVNMWIKKGQTVHLPTFRHPSKVHLWGGISIMGTTHRRIFTENSNQVVYISTLRECLIEEANAKYGDSWVLQEDDSPVHTGRAAKGWKTEFVPLRIDWPPNSPDLAPIENLWAVLKRRLIVLHPKTVSQLKQAIQDIWATFDPDFLRPFCTSMLKRIRLCLDNAGKKNNY
ncbi:hypothetical protein LOD99_11941 [Oopsacas minuta]|uniref:Transposase n=1 Tax=Oopsacas minuta TaxID=111878 RepID=A0AAV7JH34_9METZ|nr:hypothetical protein LOD99_11941 [Oopsacas minuta]